MTPPADPRRTRTAPQIKGEIARHAHRPADLDVGAVSRVRVAKRESITASPQSAHAILSADSPAVTGQARADAADDLPPAGLRSKDT